MPNKTAAKEWLVKSWHHYSSSIILFNANHYTDVVAVELHYSIELLLKAILADDNKKINKTHDLLDIYKNVKSSFTFSNEHLDLLDIVSQYHIREAYPAPERRQPPREEITEVIDFIEELFQKICTLLDISIDEIKSL